ncbi:MAG: molybdate ABC transporter substrate-binding protein [Bacteroidota bacterium]
MIFIFGIVLKSCSSEETTSTLTVATAANAQFAMKAIKKAFEEETAQSVEVIIGSSGKLTAQIMQGAPYDLLVSANLKYPNELFKAGKATDAPGVYALGHLVIWTKDEVLNLDDSLSILQSEKVRKIAIANPQNAPYGEQAVHAIQHFGLIEVLGKKGVYAESIAQVNQYVTTQNCEVGFTAASVVQSPDLRNVGKWIAVDTAAYRPIEQGVVITKYGEMNHAEAAKAFYEFLLSTKAQAIFTEYGYTIPN